MLKVENVSFAYRETPVLQDIFLSAEAGEQVSLIGASGCGKSTLLQLIYGFHNTEGRIFWKDTELRGPNYNLVPGETFIKYLAQDFDLMLPLTVAENVGKFLSNMYPVKKKRRIKELLEIVEMQDMAQEKAKFLSGGQQQRVALARALAKEPELLLLDEPFSHIDQFRKNNLRRNLFAYLRDRNITCITATHDSSDALSFADKTIVLREGRIHAQERPERLYQQPPDKYVASLFGDVNEINLQILLPQEKSNKKVLLYPHEIKFTGRSSSAAKVLENYFKGSYYLIKAELSGQIIYFSHSSSLPKENMVFLKISEKLIRSRIL
jgi:ABC-type Fe3+/spermidine/putrescine transport system ATPase subunit